MQEIINVTLTMLPPNSFYILQHVVVCFNIKLHILCYIYYMEKIKYTSLNSYIKNKYNEKLYKISLDAGLTCPNRDGTLGNGGCLFCSEGGSGDFALKCNATNIKEQIENAKELISNKSNATHFIAYFQAFTNTYGPVEYLKSIFFEAINHPDVAILSIATRCDCISDEVLLLLTELNKIKPVWIEMGLQSSNNNTLKNMNCCYTYEQFCETATKLSNAGIDVICHLILGLPNETADDMLKSVRDACALPIKGIKLQLLHILKDTALAIQYEKQPFHIMELNEYCELIAKCLQIVPASIIVHRLTGDGPKNLLIAPKWSANKKNVLNTLSKYIESY